MEYHKQLRNQTEDRPLLFPHQMDAEIERLQGIVKAQAGAIVELQAVISKIVKEKKK